MSVLSSVDVLSLLSLVRAPTELAELISAGSDNIDASSIMSNNQLGSSLQPQHESVPHVTDVVVTDEAVMISSCEEELKNLGDSDIFRTDC